jgi:hypothetical protein
MKYFTPDLYVRLQTCEGDAVEALHAEWEHAASSYERRLKRIRTELPKSLRILLDDYYLHDADVLNLAQRSGAFVIVLQLSAPPRDIVVLTYELVEPATIESEALPADLRSHHVQWMFDEVNLVPRKKHFSHELMLSNGWDIRLTFRDVRVVVAQPLFQVVDLADRAVQNQLVQPA